MMIWWRFKGVARPWQFGYMTQVGNGLVRMGRWNGDTVGGVVVSESEIETMPYRS